MTRPSADAVRSFTTEVAVCANRPALVPDIYTRYIIYVYMYVYLVTCSSSSKRHLPRAFRLQAHDARLGLRDFPAFSLFSCHNP